MDIDWSQTIADLGPRVFRYFRARFSHEEAADLTQETMTRLVRKSRQGVIDPKRGDLAMYAFGIARFVALEAKKTSPLVLAVADQENIMQENVEHQQSLVQLRQALEQLPSDQREIIILMIDQELRLQDIANLLDLPLGTVKSHIFRAKETLRQILVHNQGAK